mgnify:CR=1 FL=1
MNSGDIAECLDSESIFTGMLNSCIENKLDLLSDINVLNRLLLQRLRYKSLLFDEILHF